MLPHRYESPPESNRNPKDVRILSPNCDRSHAANCKYELERKMIMKKFMKKTTAVVSSLLMTSALALSAMPVFASGPIEVDPAEAQKTFSISKDIVVFNTDASDIFEPNVTYSYSIAPAETTSATISDANGNSVTVRKGIPGAVTLKGANDTVAGAAATIVFGDEESDKASIKTMVEADTVDTDDTIKKITDSMEAAIDASKFPTPGVYRYVITDTTTDATLKAAGIVRDDTNYDENLYLDVYIKKDADGNSVVYGYVLFKDNTTDGANHSFVDDATDDDIVLANDTAKVSGYTTDSEQSDGGAGGEGTTQGADPATIYSDQYHTYNVTVEKEVTGDLADKENEFPFAVSLTNGTITSLADFSVEELEKNDTYAADAATGVALSDSGAWASSDLKLKDGDSFMIVGLPAGTSIQVSETNNTADVYTVTAQLNKGAEGYGATYLDEKQVKSQESNGMAKAELINNKDASNPAKPVVDVIHFTNTLEEISPTGLLFMIAPFAAMLAFGVVMITLFVKNKKRDESDDMI